ncbi:MAG: UDP-glucose 4-epimerase GalE [Candidatus Nanopelagicales bacterium]
MTWMVTGGAGYIGAHIARSFLQADQRVVVLDDLTLGRREFVPADAAFVEASVLDSAALERTFSEHEVTGVVHLAGLKYAGVSVDRPLDFYETNVEGTRRLVQAMVKSQVRNLVFSSSAAIFGTPDVEIVDEETAKQPESPYGETKLIGEWLIHDVARAADLNHCSLRYFNVVGSGDPVVYDVSPYNLFPAVFSAITDGRRPQLNGTDYPTPDGTCVRDYIHVQDVADAHVVVAQALDRNEPIATEYNIGSGSGTSVLEILQAMKAVVPSLEWDVADRRPGDPARIVTSSQRLNDALGWTSKYDLNDMVESAWAAWQRVSG